MLAGRCSGGMLIPEKLKNPKRNQHRGEDATKANILQMILLPSSWKVTLTWFRCGRSELELKNRFVSGAAKVRRQKSPLW